MSDNREMYQRCLRSLLRPCLRLALRHSFKLRDLVECCKKVLVELSEEELHSLGEKPTASKLSAMTGIQRKEIVRILQSAPEPGSSSDVITRVIGLWQSADEFTTTRGRPRVLQLKSRQGEFSKLVARVSTDLNPYTVAFELERIGAVEQTKNGLRLLKSGFEVSEDAERGLQFLAQDSDDLHRSVLQNISESPNPPNLHSSTRYDNISVSREAEIRTWFLKKGAKFHDDARRYLSALDRDINPKNDSSDARERKLAVTIGSFSFTEIQESKETE